MNKPLPDKIRNVLKEYLSIVFNTAETSKMGFSLKIKGVSDYFYDVVKTLEETASKRKNKFLTIDLDFEDFGLNEIDEDGKIIVPNWLKENEGFVILVYNVDSLRRNDYRIRQLREIILRRKIEDINIPPYKHFVVLSDKKLGIEEKVIEIDLKRVEDERVQD